MHICKYILMGLIGTLNYTSSYTFTCTCTNIKVQKTMGAYTAMKIISSLHVYALDVVVFIAVFNKLFACFHSIPVHITTLDFNCSPTQWEDGTKKESFRISQKKLKMFASVCIY